MLEQGEGTAGTQLCKYKSPGCQWHGEGERDSERDQQLPRAHPAAQGRTLPAEEMLPGGHIHSWIQVVMQGMAGGGLEEGRLAGGLGRGAV